MGEVYRASDLTLNQPVALKFLPHAAASRPDLLDRFRGEVRIAREVSHPNVCRVYDIGEAEGATFLTMQYVDGEDLASLLRRIGRLPADKATEIARKLCAGLAAAHDKGVLHRDLKPANIMIDGRGQVLITDFGLAAIAGQVQDITSGTPAYMAPEQRAGREVSIRSDLYSLGLIMREMFAERDRDPAIKRLIERCLEDDPGMRPPSALPFAMALPGGDPLAAAMAAGETPSPEMVAAAGKSEGIGLRAASICLAVVVSGVIATTILGSKVSAIEQTPFEHPPAVLAQKARELI